MLSLSRIDVLKKIKEEFKDSPIVVPLAATSRAMYSLGYSQNEFYTLGSMGMPISISSGIALGLKKQGCREKLLCIEGDGSVLMSLNSLATLTYLELDNLILIILDNESYSVTGGQEAQSKKIDLSKIASSLNFKVKKVLDIKELVEAINFSKKNTGPHFIHIKINNSKSEGRMIYENPVTLRNNFKNYLTKLLEANNA